MVAGVWSTAMATVPTQVDSILKSVQSLRPAQRREFTRRLIAAGRGNGLRLARPEPTDQALIETTKLRLAPRDMARIRRLSNKSEQGTLTERERREYLRLATKAERLSVVRVQALAELARRRGKSLRALMREIGWEVPSDD